MIEEYRQKLLQRLIYTSFAQMSGKLTLRAKLEALQESGEISSRLRDRHSTSSTDEVVSSQTSGGSLSNRC
jgi:hypothetical protein